MLDVRGVRWVWLQWVSTWPTRFSGLNYGVGPWPNNFVCIIDDTSIMAKKGDGTSDQELTEIHLASLKNQHIRHIPN
jgi:hypothetical protein